MRILEYYTPCKHAITWQNWARIASMLVGFWSISGTLWHFCAIEPILTQFWHVYMVISYQQIWTCQHIKSAQCANSSLYQAIFITLTNRNGPLTRYVDLRVAHAPGMPGTFSPPPTSKETPSKWSRHASRHVRHARAVMHVGIAKPRWRRKRSRHSRRMRNPQFYVSGKRPMIKISDDIWHCLPDELVHTSVYLNWFGNYGFKLCKKTIYICINIYHVFLKRIQPMLYWFTGTRIRTRNALFNKIYSYIYMMMSRQWIEQEARYFIN